MRVGGKETYVIESTDDNEIRYILNLPRWGKVSPTFVSF